MQKLLTSDIISLLNSEGIELCGVAPTLGSQFLDGDIIHVAILASALERFKTLLGLSEGG